MISNSTFNTPILFSVSDSFEEREREKNSKYIIMKISLDVNQLHDTEIQKKNCHVGNGVNEKPTTTTMAGPALTPPPPRLVQSTWNPFAFESSLCKIKDHYTPANLHCRDGLVDSLCVFCIETFHKDHQINKHRK